MTTKIFKSTVSDRLKKALIVGAALFTLGGAQEAKAQGILEKIAETVEDVNHVLNQKLLIPTANIKHQVGRLERNLGRLDSNTGGVISKTVNAAVIARAQKTVKQAVEQNGGTYVVSTREFSQSAPQKSGEAYLNEVKGKLNKNSRSDVSQQTTQSVNVQKSQKKNSSVYQSDVNKVLDFLSSNSR